MAKEVVKNPEARLDDRDGDVELTDEQYLKISLFAQLKKKISLDKFPGALKLRRYRKGEEIFRQGEAGWTAFYILTTEDVLTLWEQRLQTIRKENEQRRIQIEIPALRERVGRLRLASADDGIRTAAKVYIAVARTPKAQRGNLAKRLLGFSNQSFAPPMKNDQQRTLYIPVGGAMTFNMDSYSAPLSEGDMFGEMSCMYRTPRSATVVAQGDTYVLEMLRNILDQIQRDPIYKARMDDMFKKRVLGLQLRKFPIFSGLSDQDFETLRNEVELQSFEPGQLICDEHDRSDGIYIVRTGLIKVMKNTSHLLPYDGISDWAELGKGFQIGAQVSSSPLGKFFSMLPAAVREAFLANPDLAKWPRMERLPIVLAINDLLKLKDFSEWKEFQHLTGRPEFKEQIARLPEKRDDWTDIDLRFCNRIAIELLFPKAIKRHERLPGPEMILNYCSPGDFIGEIGVMMGLPRSATCMAYGHPNDCGLVDVVKISADTFRRLVASSATLKAKVDQEIAARRRQTVERLAVPVWDDTNQVQFSDKFEELGLIQGQKLMLIDLDRCTRCDECVKACVNTHDDGHTRLFLDGPRFGKYLVPTACRSCLDPVCMIGCPVGSIHRGDNRQIVIEDWCIGCGLCADKCPYGSIQMHDLGILPEKVRGWRYLPGACVPGDTWMTKAYHDRKWLEGEGPFTWNRDLHDVLLTALRKGGTGSPDIVYFRHEFELDPEQAKTAGELRFAVVSAAATVQLWINGKELMMDDKPKRGRREYTLPPLPPKGKDSELAALPRAPLTDFVKPGVNLMAVRVEGKVKLGETLMLARIDEIHKPDVPDDVEQKVAEEVREKMVTDRAVVCDLCSTLPAQVPACVRACPHDAAMRVNARFEFPVG